MNKHPVTGSCLCGLIEFSVNKIENQMAHCHCKMCRKFHGAAFATFGEAKSSNFKWLKGETLLNSYKASNGTLRQFCKKCGSSLIFKTARGNNELVEFSLSALDSEIELKPDAHIHISSKASWHEINDNLPQYQEGRTAK